MRIVSAGLCLAVSLALSAGAGAQEKKDTLQKKDAMPQMDSAMAAGMKKWEEAMTPGAPHKMLAGLTGSWKAESKMWWSGPGTEATTAEGRNESTMILGGRFLTSSYTSNLMDRKFEGHGMLGYDNTKKKYIQLWLDNFSTSVSVAEGTADKSGNVITLWGTMDEPMTGERDKIVKYVYRLTGKDKYVFEVHDFSFPEPHTKVMEITYTRVK
jgi:Protein of unknown function (DUF1579)